MAKPAPKVETPKVEPAPQVEAATAAAAKPRAAPVVDGAPMVEPAAADPPIDDGSFVPIPTKCSNVTAAATAKQNSLREEDDQPTHNSLSINKLRNVHMMTFESLAGVILGPAQKDLCQKLCPCLGERSYISYGEIQRYILLTDHNLLFVYAESTDPSPL